MATATIEAPAIYSGRFHADGRAVTVTPELLALHRRCGGGEGDPIALPGLPSLIRRAVALSMPLSAPVLLADGPNNVTYWARVVPDGEEADLQLFDWNGTGGAMEHALESAVREQDFLRASADWLWEADASLCFTSLSEAVTAVFGQPAAILVGRPMAALLRPFPATADGDTDFRSSADPAEWFSNRIVEVKDHAPARFYRLNARPVFDGEELTGFRGTAVEVERPVAPPAASKTRAAPSPMAEGEAEPDGAFPMTDVLRAPLEKITRQAEAIRSQSFGHLKSVYTDYAGDIATAARHLRTLIDDVFDVAAIESGTVSLLIENVDLTTLAEEARAIVSQRAAASGSSIIWRSPPVSVIVRADRGRALQILINLIQNAVKFAGDAGPVRLALEVGEGEARISVDDQGGGVAEADRERVFTKFERLRQNAEGSGLGLYISRALARAMGGDILVTESPESGARFTLRLPRA